MARALESPFQAQPSALATPVPGADEEIDQELLGRLAQQFQLPAQEAPPAEAPLVAPEGEAVDEQLLERLGQQFQAVPPQLQPGSALEFAERAKFSFAQTETEQRSFLEGLPGVTKVGKEDDEFVLTRNGKKQRVDPEQFEFFADVFADLARPALETAIEIPAAAAGALAGTAAAPGPGTAAGLVAGGAVGAAAATTAGDFVAEQLIGIERDPERSRAQELAFSAALGGTLNLIGGKLLGVAAKRRLAKEIGEENVAALGKVDRVGEQFRSAIEDLSDAGLTTTVEGADGKPINILLSNLDINTPEARQLTQQLRSSKDFLRIQDELAKVHVENIDVILESIGDTQGVRNFDKIAEGDQQIAEKTVNFVRNLKKQEGQRIGEFKARAAKQFRTSPAPVERTDQTLVELFEDFGVRREGDELIGLDPESISRAVAIENPNLLKPIVAVVEDLNETLFNKGGLSPSDLEKFVTRVGRLNESRAISKEGTLKRSVAKLSSALRSDRIDVVEEALPDTLKGEFRQSMQKFASIARNTSEVAELIDGDELATDAFVNSIFKGGKDSLRRLRAVKSVIRSENPALWRELSGEFLNKVVLDASEKGTERPTIQAIITRLNKFGPDFRKELLADSPFSVKNLQSVLTLAKRFEKTNLDAASEETITTLLSSFRKIFSPFTDARLNSARNIFNITFGTPKVRKLLTQEGLDQFLEAGTLKERKFRKMIGDILSSTTGVGTVRAGQAAAGVAGREEIREP